MLITLSKIYNNNIVIWKLAGGISLLLIAFPLVMLTSGAILLVIYGYNPFNYDLAISLWAWPDYYFSWWNGELPGSGERIAMTAFVGVFVVYLLIPMIIVSAFRQNRELHGSARWATSGEIKKAGLFSESGIVVGKYNNKLLRFPGQQFVLLAAPTRSGKGVGVVIPNLLSYEESVCVLDIKQENFDITAGYRQQALKQEVYLFNPFSEDIDDQGKPAPRTHRYNFLDSVSQGVFRVGEILSISNAIWSQGGKDAFWNDNARNLFLAVTLFLCELRDQRDAEGNVSDLPNFPVSMGEILRQTSGRGTGLPIKKYFETKVLTYDWLSSECRAAFANFLSASDDVLSSILSTFNAPLLPWRNPVVDAATSASDFDLRDVRKKKMSIYIGITPNKLDDAKLIVNLLFSQLINLNTKELPQKNPLLKYQCLVLMDEFTSIGVVNIIAKSVSYIAGYNLRLLPIIQSTAQLESERNYGRDDARTLVVNHALQIVYAPRDQKDANEVSESLGYFTEKGRSISRQRGFGGGGKGSESTSDHKRALLLPQEVKEIGQWKEIIFLENTKPILCDKVRYFDDPLFTSRLLPAPDITSLDIEVFLAKSNNRKREVDVETEMDLATYALKPPVTAEYLDIYDKTELPPPEDPLDEVEVNNYVLDTLEAMGVDPIALSQIKFDIDMLDVSEPMLIEGTDEEIARQQTVDAFNALNHESISDYVLAGDDE